VVIGSTYLPVIPLAQKGSVVIVPGENKRVVIGSTYLSDIPLAQTGMSAEPAHGEGE